MANDIPSKKTKAEWAGLVLAKIRLILATGMPSKKGSGWARLVFARMRLRDLKYDLLEHEPYSPDLAPSDFHLFPKTQIPRWRQRFGSTLKLQTYVADLPENYYTEGIMALEDW